MQGGREGAKGEEGKLRIHEEDGRREDLRELKE